MNFDNFFIFERTLKENISIILQGFSVELSLTFTQGCNMRKNIFKVDLRKSQSKREGPRKSPSVLLKPGPFHESGH